MRKMSVGEMWKEGGTENFFLPLFLPTFTTTNPFVNPPGRNLFTAAFQSKAPGMQFAVEIRRWHGSNDAGSMTLRWRSSRFSQLPDACAR